MECRITALRDELEALESEIEGAASRGPQLSSLEKMSAAHLGQLALRAMFDSRWTALQRIREVFFRWHAYKFTDMGNEAVEALSADLDALIMHRAANTETVLAMVHLFNDPENHSNSYEECYAIVHDLLDDVPESQLFDVIISVALFSELSDRPAICAGAIQILFEEFPDMSAHEVLELAARHQRLMAHADRLLSG